MKLRAMSPTAPSLSVNIRRVSELRNLCSVENTLHGRVNYTYTRTFIGPLIYSNVGVECSVWLTGDGQEAALARLGNGQSMMTRSHVNMELYTAYRQARSLFVAEDRENSYAHVLGVPPDDDDDNNNDDDI